MMWPFKPRRRFTVRGTIRFNRKGLPDRCYGAVTLTAWSYDDAIERAREHLRAGEPFLEWRWFQPDDVIELRR